MRAGSSRVVGADLAIGCACLAGSLPPQATVAGAVGASMRAPVGATVVAVGVVVAGDAEGLELGRLASTSPPPTAATTMTIPSVP